MNGIYDFESYRTPYLDVEMLMERKAKKREKQMLILACIAAVMMGAVAILMLVATALIDFKLFIVLTTGFAIYIVVGAICVGKFMKKREEEVWQPLA